MNIMQMLLDKMPIFGIDMSPEKFASPLFIIGIILFVVGLILTGGANRFDDMIRAKRSASTRVKEEEVNKGEDVSIDADNNISDDTMGAETLDNESTLRDKKSITRLADNEEDENGELSLFKKKDGTINYYMVFKMVGLIVVLVSAILVVIGLK